MSESMQIFDRPLVRRRRDRAAAGFARYDFLKRAVANSLVERLQDIRRSFPIALDLGCHTGTLARAISGINGVETVITADLSPAMAARSGALALAADEEFLPIADQSLDLVVTALSLHWVNDLPGALIQINRALKPDGLFLGAMIGGESLTELRQCLTEAETLVSGGMAPRISPMTQVRDMGGLLQRAGFALPVVDVESHTITYESAFALMADLRGMGETGAAFNRYDRPTRRALFIETARLYQERFAEPDGRIPATVEVLYLLGWAPHADQPRPLRPGSARSRLATALGTAEQGTGEKAGE